MIATLRGHVLSIAADSCIIEVQGVGYQVFMPLSALDELRRLSGEVLIHTYQYVREDTLALYGFLRPEDKNLFTQVIGVSGIGPKTGLALLSAFPADRLRDAVRLEDAKLLASVPGIGLKTAQRLILELKSKLGKLPSGAGEGGDGPTAGQGGPMNDAVAALTALGYNISDALRAVEEADSKHPGLPTGELVREALKRLARK
ncbi:MAG TPA: Holliday junction branch migration protein RuvA [Firmicutes bacterium]|nr:Holliday junction branch migration protein RuvA [Bacillota bacterium]HOQ25049.1 Holliday junction branch migration protein RuvA [Bacillota bacterium]HPT68353.1 Holliday junction branch migration protein RuvA [Bacillota bacterium]